MSSGVYLVSASSIDNDRGAPKYTSPDDVNLNMSSDQQQSNPFRGMGKEELLRHSSQPFWVRLRMICVGIILIGWFALIITVVALIFAYPKCRDKDARSWWQNDVMYRVYVRSFYDSDGDGNGDIKGVQSKLDYIKGLGVGAVSLSPIYQMDGNNSEFGITNHKSVDPIYGTLQDLKNLIKAVHDKGMKIILDFIPNQTSAQHSWFQQSKQSNDTYKNFYVWSDNPTNWLTIDYSSAWEMDKTRDQYYLHQFDVNQPDLNLRSKLVLDQLKDIMEYWMITEGVDGFYVRNSGYMMEDYDMRNESTLPPNNREYTYGIESNIYQLSKFRAITNELSNTSTKILMADRSGTVMDKMSYYGVFPGSGVQLSLNPIGKDSCNGKCIKDYTKDWISKFSTNKWPTWMTGVDEMPRFGSRFPANYSRPFYMLSMLLPGTPILYYGEEIGMSDIAGTNTMRGLMQWENTTNAGFQNCTSTCTNPWNGVNSDYGTVNVKSQGSVSGSLHGYIKELISLRANDAFRYGEYRTAYSNDNIFSFVREFDGVTGYLVAINFGGSSETHDYTSFHSTIDATSSAVMTTGSDVGFNTDADVDTTKLTLGPLQGIVVSWDFKAKEL